MERIWAFAVTRKSVHMHLRCLRLTWTRPFPLMSKRQVEMTRSSADADNRRYAFSGQSKSTNMVPFWARCDFSLSMWPDGRKSFKIGLVVLMQYRLCRTATQPATQPASHVAVAITLYAKASSLKRKTINSTSPTISTHEIKRRLALNRQIRQCFSAVRKANWMTTGCYCSE